MGRVSYVSWWNLRGPKSHFSIVELLCTCRTFSNTSLSFMPNILIPPGAPALCSGSDTTAKLITATPVNPCDPARSTAVLRAVQHSILVCFLNSCLNFCWKPCQAVQSRSSRAGSMTRCSVPFLCLFSKSNPVQTPACILNHYINITL